MLGCPFADGFQHRLRYLLDKQSESVSALDNVLSDARGQHLFPVTPSMMVAISRSPSRFSVSAVTWGRPIKAAQTPAGMYD